MIARVPEQSDRSATLGPVMRGALMASGPMNLLGASIFSPPMHGLRRALFLPEADPFYLWVLSSWVLAFGVAYVHMGWTGRPNRGVLALGAWGKGVFGLALAAIAVGGQVPAVVGASALPDILMAILFGWWLWRTSSMR